MNIERMKTLWILLMVLVTVLPLKGTSIIFPTYSTPLCVDDSLIVLSVDRSEMIALTKSGKEQWRQKLSTKGRLFRHHSGKVVLAQGSAVMSVNMKDGSMEPLFHANPKVSYVAYDADSNLFWGEKDQDGPVLVLFDGVTFACLAKEKHGEAILYADKDYVVLAKANREPFEGGYTFSNGWIEAFDRRSMKKLWATAFLNESSPMRYVVRCGDYFVCDDVEDLVVIEIASGKMRRKAAIKDQGAHGPNGLRNENGAITYCTSKLNFKDFGQNEQIFYKLTIPDLQLVERRSVKVIEVASSEKVGDLLITDALYRTACFRSDGTKLWEHFQLHRTSAMDGVIYFSDSNNGVARMGALDVVTGKQRFFLSETIKKE